MSNKGLFASMVALFGLTGAAIVGGLVEGESGSGAAPTAARFRVAVFSGATCPAEWKCSGTSVRDGRCLCVTPEAALPNEAAAPSSSLMRQLRVCRSLANPADFIVGMVPLAQVGTPEGYRCEVAVESTLIANTFGGIQTEVEETLAEKCGLPVTSHTWYCCPHCLLFDAGCPPCPQLCAYWDRWPGHESECK